MKINPISQINVLQANRTYKKNNNNSYYSRPLQNNAISFKSGGVAELLIIIKGGMKCANSATKIMKKWKFGREVEKRLANPDTSDNCKQIAETLSILANIPRGLKTSWLCDSAEEWYERALGIIPLVEKTQNDIYGGHAAKAAFMAHLVDIGYFIRSKEFYNQFNALPANYKRDKIYMLEKMFNERGVVSNVADDIGWSEAKANINYDPASGMAVLTNTERREYVQDNMNRFKKEAADEIAIAATSLISHLDKKEYSTFFNSYSDYINTYKNRAEKSLMDKETSFYNNFFKHYANNSWDNSYERDVAKSCINTQMQASAQNNVMKKFDADEELSGRLINYYIGTTQNFDFLSYMDDIYTDKFAVMKRFNTTEQKAEGLIRDYLSIKAVMQKFDFFNIMKNIRPDRETLMEKFNISEQCAKELIKDYELVSATAQNKNSEEVRKLFAKRIEKKQQNELSDIQSSANGLIELSGRKEELKDLLKKKTPKAEDVQVHKKTEDFSSGSTDYDDLESWEKAELQAPWIVP